MRVQWSAIISCPDFLFLFCMKCVATTIMEIMKRIRHFGVLLYLRIISPFYCKCIFRVRLGKLLRNLKSVSLASSETRNGNLKYGVLS